MMQSEQIDQIAAALAVAQGQLKSAVFDKVNPHFKSKYASLASIQDAIRDPLSKNGLSITHQTVNGTMISRLMHNSGQWLGTEWQFTTNGAKPQERGSERTYAKRYNTCDLVGISGDEDDDANEAQKAASEKVSDQQISEIQQALDTRGMSTERLMKWAKASFHGTEIQCIADIPASGFKYCIETIRKSGEPR